MEGIYICDSEIGLQKLSVKWSKTLNGYSTVWNCWKFIWSFNSLCCLFIYLIMSVTILGCCTHVTTWILWCYRVTRLCVFKWWADMMVLIMMVTWFKACTRTVLKCLNHGFEISETNFELQQARGHNSWSWREGT